MPITFIDIERQKTARIAFFFVFLIVLYFLVSAVLYFGITFFLLPIAFAGRFSLGISLFHIGIIFSFSLLIAAIHFWFSSTNVVSSITRGLGALPPDPRDNIHKRLLNIMDEIRVASGNRKTMNCMVIPSLSMNALAADDLRGEAVIAITEGLLSRLSRDQLEAVIAHEAYHVLSGDCRETTLATSLFGMYIALLENMQSLAEDERQRGFEPSFLPLWILLKLSDLLRMFISREREYRADAASVRMTRNPLAMAEALHFLSRNWNGGGLISTGIEMLCIVNPEENALDESEGWWPDLMSTHPPIGKRIRQLLTMAHSSMQVLEQRMREGKNVNMAEAVAGMASAYICPACMQPLQTMDYENTQVHQCRSCRGTLVENDKIPRIIARREQECTERVKALARAVVYDNQRAMSIRHMANTGKRSMAGFKCSKCNNVMFRTFYSGAYLIEIDRCSVCRLTWFDADELEMLQCLIENRITGTIESVSDVQDS